MKKWMAIFFSVAMLCVIFSGCQKEQEIFPSKEINLVIPYDAGGANDRCARMISSIAEKYKLTDQAVIVTNIAGAGTKTGISTVVKADPDGYTLLVHHNAMVTAAALGQFEEEIQWDKGLRPIAQILETPLTLAVLEDSRWESMEDLVEEIIANPGQISFGFPGINSPQAFAFQNIISNFEADGTKMDVRYVYYEGGSAVKTALMNGEIDVMPGITMDTVPSALDGTYRILSVVTDEPLEALPQVPTFSQAGYQMPEATDGALRMVVWAPKDTPDEVVDWLQEFLKNVCATDEWKEFIQENSAIDVFRDAQEVTEVYNADAEVYAGIAQQLQN